MTVTSRRPDLDEGDAARDTGPDLRWVLAGDRTLLAWFRLSLVLFLLGLLLLVLVPPGVATVRVSVVAALLMLGCAATAVIGVRRRRRVAEGAQRR